MEKVPESMEASRGIQSTLFYLPEYRELCVGLLGSYDGAKWSRNYLCDLVDTNHLFLKMLEGSTKEKRILVKRTKRTRIPRRKKKSGSRKSTKRVKKNSLEEWNCLENEVSEILSSDFELEAAIPFDAASDTPIDEQKGLALSQIATHVSKKDFNKAVSLFRAAKEVWPDDDQLSMENAISALKSIFLEASPQLDDDPGAQESSEEEDADDEDADEIDEEEETEVRVTSRESEFDFRGFIEKYATAKIVSNFANLFKQYSALTPLTLHAILKMFHRYVFDMGYPALICQASIFQTFQSLIKVSHIREDLKDAHKFFLHFWSKFTKLAASNPKIFIEILFWKTSREAQEIQEGYTQYGGQSQQASNGVKRLKVSVVKKTLSEEEENEIIVLAEEFASLSEKTMKQVDWINDKLIRGPKVKKVISTFLAEKGLLIASTKKQRKKQPWSESDTDQLKTTYEEFKNSRSVVRHILDKLSEKRSRNALIDKMIELKLIRDKTELGNRRNRRAGNGKAIGMDFLRENGVSFDGPSNHSGDSGPSSDSEKSSDSEVENKSSKNSSDNDQVSATNSVVVEKMKKNRILVVDSDDEDIGIPSVKNGDIGIENSGNGDIGDIGIEKSQNGDAGIKNSENGDIGSQSDDEKRKLSVFNLNSDSDSDASEVPISFKRGNRKAMIESDSD